MIGIQDIAALSQLPPWHLHRLGIRIGVKRLFLAAAVGFRSKWALEITQADLIVGLVGITNNQSAGTQLIVGVNASAITGTQNGILNMDWQTLDDPQQGARFVPGVVATSDSTAGAYANNAGELFVVTSGVPVQDGMLPVWLIRKVVGTPIFLTIQPGADNQACDASIKIMTMRKLRDTDVRESLEAYVEPFIGPPVPVMARAIRDRLLNR